MLREMIYLLKTENSKSFAKTLFLFLSIAATFWINTYLPERSRWPIFGSMIVVIATGFLADDVLIKKKRITPARIGYYLISLLIIAAVFGILQVLPL